MHINSDIIKVDRIGWRLFYKTDNEYVVLINSGFESIENPGDFYFFKPDIKCKRVVFPVVYKYKFTEENEIIRHNDTLSTLNGVDITDYKRENLSQVTGLSYLSLYGIYVDSCGKVPSETEIIEMIKLDRNDKRRNNKKRKK